MIHSINPINLILICFIQLFLFNFALADSCPIKDGDIIFQESFSSQSKFIKRATRSKWSHVGIIFKTNIGWSVYEAVSPVKITKLENFIKRYKKIDIEVRRLKNPLSKENILLIKNELNNHLGKPYDFVFEMDDEKLYCSEYVYKAIETVMDQKVGTVELIKDLKDHLGNPIINDPVILEFAKQRWKEYKTTPFNLEEWKQTQIITPASMYRSDLLEKVISYPFNLESLTKANCL